MGKRFGVSQKANFTVPMEGGRKFAFCAAASTGDVYMVRQRKPPLSITVVFPLKGKPPTPFMFARCARSYPLPNYVRSLRSLLPLTPFGSIA